MFVLGHLGIGNKLASPWSKNLPKKPLFLGMLLPDLIDKPLYYSHDFDIVTCTRTFGHTGLFLFLILSTATFTKSKWLAALALGIATHLLLDCLIDRFSPEQPSSALRALTWPFIQTTFATYNFNSIGDHLRHLTTGPILVSEAIGLVLIGWDYWKSVNE